MERKTNQLARVSALALALGMTAFTLQAEQGTFNLPVEAHWGMTTLEPGEHALRVPFSTGQPIIEVGTAGDTRITIPAFTELTPGIGQAYLELERVGREYYVKTYQSAAGRRYSFNASKALRLKNPAREGTEAAALKVVVNK